MNQHFFLHLGLHKTATTALQKFLEKNFDTLLANDVRYVCLQKMRDEFTPLFCSLTNGKRKMLFDLIESYPNKKILLSDENIFGGPGEIRDGDLYHYGKNRVLSFCEQAGKRPVTLFITLRNPVTFIPSMYCEFLRHHSYINFNDYLANFDLKSFSFVRIFSWLNKVPRNTRVIVTPFEAPANGGLMATAELILKETVGAHAIGSFGSFPKNKSRSSFSQEELDLAATISKQAGGTMAQSFLKNLDIQGCRFGNQKFAPFDSETVRMLDERYQNELRDFFSSFA